MEDIFDKVDKIIILDSGLEKKYIKKNQIKFFESQYLIKPHFLKCFSISIISPI